MFLKIGHLLKFTVVFLLKNVNVFDYFFHCCQLNTCICSDEHLYWLYSNYLPLNLVVVLEIL